MGSFPSANPSLPTSIPGIYEPPSAVVGTVPIASGGTGQTTAAAALAALGGVGAGTHFVGNGANGSNYSVSSNTFVDLDATNLKTTKTVPVGSIALCFANVTGSTASASSLAIGIAIDGTVPGASGAQLGGGQGVTQLGCMAVLVGDGASHTFSLQALASGNPNTIVAGGSSSYPNPTLIVLIVPAS